MKTDYSTFRRPALLAAVVAMLLLVGPPQAAYAHFTGRNAVDAGEIRYDDHTQWDDARLHGHAAWNALGNVDMWPDGWWTYTDLDIQDYSENDGLCGFYSNEPGADDVNLNNNYFNGYSTGQRRGCMTHEFGHAYGLDHSYADQVMDSCPVCTTVYTYPQDHDKADWKQLWG